MQRGDTLERIAGQYYREPSRWREIAERNRAVVPDPDSLPVGVVLVLPGLEERILPSLTPPAEAHPPEREQHVPVIPVRTYVVKNGDSLSKIAEDHYGFARMWRTIYEANLDVVDDPDRLPVGLKLVLPAR